MVIAYAEAAKHGSHTESARSFVAQHAATATRVYVDGREQLSPSTRKQLLRTLVSFDSETAVPAFIEAIQQYARTGESVDDAIWACQGVMQRRVPQYGAPLLEAYLALDPGDKDGHRYSRHLAAAMEYQVDAEWVPTLSEELAKPLERPTRFDDTGAVKAFRRALFRQTVAARLLGDLQVQQAVDPLLYVLIDQGKPEIHPAAELSLAKLAEYALPRMLSLLRREDEQLVRLGAQAKPDVGPSHVYFATKWLDLIRHPSIEQELLETWAQTKEPVARTLLVRSLSRLPGSKAGVPALKTTFIETNIKVTLPDGESALETLAQAAVQFFDPTIVPWLMDRAGRVPSVWSRRADVQLALVMAMNALITEEQLKQGQAVAQRYGGKVGLVAFEQARQLVQRCKMEGACYAKALTSAPTDTFAVTKAATMVAVWGGDGSVDGLLEAMKQLEEPLALHQVLAALEHLSFKDPKPVQARLTQLAAPEGDHAAWSGAKTAAISASVARLSAW